MIDNDVALTSLSRAPAIGAIAGDTVRGTVRGNIGAGGSKNKMQQKQRLKHERHRNMVMKKLGIDINVRQQLRGYIEQGI